jgi:hypothetical protein
MLNNIDFRMADSISECIHESIKTHLESNVFTRFDDSMNNSVVIWSQLINTINSDLYEQH